MNKVLSRMAVLGSVFFWSLACTSEPAPKEDEQVTPAPAPAPDGEGKGKKGKRGKAGGRAIEASFVKLEQGDFLHLSVKTADGKEHDFVCIDDSCASAEGMAAGTEVIIEHTTKTVSSEMGDMEMDVVTSFGIAEPMGD